MSLGWTGLDVRVVAETLRSRGKSYATIARVLGLGTAEDARRLLKGLPPRVIDEADIVVVVE
jgi:nitrogen regulatory protein PII